MSETSKIQWTDATWNPWHGCHKVSQGCKFCYMFRDKERYGQDPNVVVRSKTQFTAPLKWKEPRMIFTCSWSDWFIEEADPWRDEAWDIIRRTPQHTYQILTKRPERMAGSVPNAPLPNVWLGVSCENQNAVDLRIGKLISTPAAIRFISAEPVLESITFRWARWDDGSPHPRRKFRDCPTVQRDGRMQAGHQDHLDGLRMLDWVIVGGESGHQARPFRLEWAERIIGECKEAGVPVFFKQAGSFATVDYYAPEELREWAFSGEYEVWNHGHPWNDRDGQPTPGASLIRIKMLHKGGNPEDWPEHLRVREFPALARMDGGGAEF